MLKLSQHLREFFVDFAYFCALLGNGEVPERPNGPVSKTVVRATVPRVRIPPSPHLMIGWFGHLVIESPTHALCI